MITGMDKHAYCIMAHGNWKQLQMLVNVIDDGRNDIYLHIDAKSLNDFNKWGGVKTKFSGLILTESIDVRWSDVSQVDAELLLFKHVIRSGKGYNRIHLISGSDFPLKSQDELHKMFYNDDREYLSFGKDVHLMYRRLKYYHFFVRYRRKWRVVELFRRILLVPQVLFVNRLRKFNLKFAYGQNWCSLTLPAVREIIGKMVELRPKLKYTTSADEVYKQMIIGSNDKFKIYNKPVSYACFSHGCASPKTLTMADYDNIMSSGCLFARKFDVNVDVNVINKLISTFI